MKQARYQLQLLSVSVRNVIFICFTYFLYYKAAAVECFLSELVAACLENATMNGKKRVHSDHLKQAIMSKQEKFDFLNEVVEKITINLTDTATNSTTASAAATKNKKEKDTEDDEENEHKRKKPKQPKKSEKSKTSFHDEIIKPE